MPTIAVDPDGEEIVIIGSEEFKAYVIGAIIALARTEKGFNLLQDLSTRKERTVIYKGEKNRQRSLLEKDGSWSSFVSYNPELRGKYEKDNVDRIPFVSLGHELFHSQQALDQDQDFGVINSREPFDENGELNTIPYSELEASDFENSIRQAYGYDIRRTYGSFDIGVSKDKKQFSNGSVLGRATGQYTLKSNKSYKDKLIGDPRKNFNKILNNIRKGGSAGSYSGSGRFDKGVNKRFDFRKTKGNALIIKW